MSSANITYDVVVIGAGLSGLTAAYELQKQGYTVKVLEAKNRVGGRLLTQSIPGGVVDAGGSWVGPQQTALIDLCQELGITMWPQYTSGKNILVWNNSVKTFRGELPKLSPVALIDCGWNIARLNHLARKIKRDTSSRAIYDAQTLGSWIDAHVRTDETRFLLSTMVATSFGCAPAELSLYGFLSHVASAGNLQTLTGVKNAALDRHVEGGTARICKVLADQLDGMIACGQQVRTIRRNAQGAVISTDFAQYSARYVILAVDPQTASHVTHQPQLPTARHTLQQTYVMGSGYKVHFVYKTPFWREAGFSGQSIANTGNLRITFDVTPPGAQCGVLMGFIGKAAIDDISLLDPDANDQRRESALQELAVRFGPEALHPIDYLEQDWSREPYQSGCVPMPPLGLLAHTEATLTEPIDCLRFAGAESSPIWEGHMEGAVRAGQRAAREITARKNALLN